MLERFRFGRITDFQILARVLDRFESWLDRIKAGEIDRVVLTELDADPPTPANGVIIYAKAGGLYAIGTAGTITNIAPP